MTLDEQIKLKREEIIALDEKITCAREELHTLFSRKAESICPIKIGTIIEYKPGKKGQVNSIKYHISYFDETNLSIPVDWAVAGRKIGATGVLGKKDFPPVGPATHTIKDNIFTQKTIADYLDIQKDELDDD